jgi:Tfp pilus assembly protein PilX
MKRSSAITHQKGSALLFAFILLLALTFIAVASVNTGVMEVKMASSVEEEMNAFQTAAATVDFVMSDTNYLPATGALNVPKTVLNCTNGACVTDPPGITLPGTTLNTAGSGGEEIITGTATRTADCGLPPRMSKSSSLLNFSSFGYKVASDVDKTANNRGRSHQRHGFLTLGPKC